MGVDVALFTFSLFKMKLVFIILKLFSIAVAEEMEEMPQLEIQVTKKAANCRMKAERGDHVSIHFVGSVKDTGINWNVRHRKPKIDGSPPSCDLRSGWSRALWRRSRLRCRTAQHSTNGRALTLSLSYSLVIK